MSSLQISILIGALGVVLAVVVFNAWQSRRRRSKGERTLEVLREAISKRVPAKPQTATEVPPTSRGAELDPGDALEGGATSSGEMPGPRARQAIPASGDLAPVDLRSDELRSDDLRPQDLRGGASGSGAPSSGDGRSGARSLADPRPGDATLPSPASMNVRRADPASGAELTPVELNREKQTQSAPPPGYSARFSGGIEVRIDLIVGLELWQAWRGERILQALQPMRRIGNRPLLAEGQTLGEGGEQWWTLQNESRYARIRLGLPLVNRSGPLRPTEYSDFSTALHKLRDTLGAGWIDGTEPGEMHTILERARRLDAACADLDAQVVINLGFPETISANGFAQMGSRLGLIERGSTRQARLAAGGEELFSIALGTRPDWATFMLDVPRVRVDEQPWQQMIDCAITAAAEFGGQLLDDAGQPLGAHQLSLIAQQIQTRQRQLEEAGFPPGSPIALRVFH